MHDILINLFKDDNTPFIISPFSIWHFMYLFLIVGIAVLIVLKYKNKSEETKEKVLRVIASLLFGIYILDFFSMPLSEGKINIDKLPFHFCTLAGVLIFVTRFNKKLYQFRDTAAVVGLIGTLMYIVYPSSAFGDDSSAFSYAVIQTFAFHGLLFINGMATMFFGDVKLEWKEFYKTALYIVLNIMWGAFGNAVYSSPGDSYDWCFIRGINFPALPGNWMILGVWVAFTGSAALIFLIYNLITKRLNNKANN